MSGAVWIDFDMWGNIVEIAEAPQHDRNEVADALAGARTRTVTREGRTFRVPHRQGRLDGRLLGIETFERAGTGFANDATA